MSTADLIAIIPGVVTSFVAVVGVRIAWIGLTTWKAQLKWQTDHDLARRTLIALYRYRESLFAVRHPAMYNSEMKVDDNDAKDLTADQVRNQGVILAYARRWERHQPVENELDALLLETDAVWGRELSEKVAGLKVLQRELFAYIRLHLDAHYRGPSALAESYREILRAKRDILYDLMNDDDVFRIDFESSMRPVEAYLRGKLGREV